MNSLKNEITITIVLYKEEVSLICQCLENIKNFKIIIIDNAGNADLKKNIEKKFKIYKYILNKKIMDTQKLRTKQSNNVILNMS